MKNQKTKREMKLRIGDKVRLLSKEDVSKDIKLTYDEDNDMIFKDDEHDVVTLEMMSRVFTIEEEIKDGVYKPIGFNWDIYPWMVEEILN